MGAGRRQPSGSSASGERAAAAPAAHLTTWGLTEGVLYQWGLTEKRALRARAPRRRVALHRIRPEASAVEIPLSRDFAGERVEIKRNKQEH